MVITRFKANSVPQLLDYLTGTELDKRKDNGKKPTKTEHITNIRTKENRIILEEAITEFDFIKTDWEMVPADHKE